MLSKSELSIVFGMVVGWIQLMLGQPHHAFYSLGIIMTIILIIIMGYLREIYLRLK
jgi:hypothetical protein